jgi:parallel beta-helix repeat protein
MKKILILLLVFYSWFGVAATHTVGSTGTFTTIQQVNSHTFVAGDSILFKRGEVFIGNLVISQSGTAESPIFFGTYGAGATPIITGLVTVSVWSNLGSNIWESTIAASTLSNCTMIAINGVTTPMGRYPNTGYLTLETHNANTSITDNELTTTFTGGEIAVRTSSWTLDRSTITNHVGTTISYNPALTYEPTNGWGYFIQSHINCLDVQNEWYYNTVTKKIRVYSSSIPINVKVANYDTLVTISGDYITFDGITFDGANAYGFTSSAHTNITIKNCTIRNSGINAINLDVEYASIYNCTISESNNIAIKLSDNSIYAFIANNTITNTGIYPGMGQNSTYTRVGIISNASNSVIEYNTIDSSGYIGISFDGSNVILRNNFITGFCFVLDDGAGIYTYKNPSTGPFTNRLITRNIVINGYSAIAGRTGGSNTEGIYMDDATKSVEISYNSIANIDYIGLYIHNADSINIHDNTIYNCQQQLSLMKDGISDNLIRNIKVNNNKLVAKSNSQLVFEHRSTLDDILLFGTYNNNYYTRPIKESNSISALVGGSWVTYDLQGWKTFSSQDTNSLVSVKTITDVNDFRFEYNATSYNKIVDLDGSYSDIVGNNYNRNITINPYSSTVLIKNSNISNDKVVMYNNNIITNYGKIVKY